jgi:CheY-like chemotaxis protein
VLPSTRLPRRSDTDVLVDQVRGIDSWNVARRAAEASLAESGDSREARLDAARRADVLRRVQQAVIDRTAMQLRISVRLLGQFAPPRVLLAHRNEWFRGTVGQALLDAGVDVVSELENGADAVGAAIAEQPDVVLLEDRLPMIGAVDVIRWIAEHAPSTVCAVQVASEHDIKGFLDAGARGAFSRRIPPADVAHELAALLTAPADR